MSCPRGLPQLHSDSLMIAYSLYIHWKWQRPVENLVKVLGALAQTAGVVWPCPHPDRATSAAMVLLRRFLAHVGLRMLPAVLDHCNRHCNWFLCLLIPQFHAHGGASSKRGQLWWQGLWGKKLSPPALSTPLAGAAGRGRTCFFHGQ